MVHREYAARAKAEKASGGSGWESQRWYQDLLERASVSIARSNYERDAAQQPLAAASVRR